MVMLSNDFKIVSKSNVFEPHKLLCTSQKNNRGYVLCGVLVDSWKKSRVWIDCNTHTYLRKTEEPHSCAYGAASRLHLLGRQWVAPTAPHGHSGWLHFFQISLNPFSRISFDHWVLGLWRIALRARPLNKFLDFSYPRKRGSKSHRRTSLPTEESRCRTPVWNIAPGGTYCGPRSVVVLRPLK